MSVSTVIVVIIIAVGFFLGLFSHCCQFFWQELLLGWAEARAC